MHRMYQPRTRRTPHAMSRILAVVFAVAAVLGIAGTAQAVGPRSPVASTPYGTVRTGPVGYAVNMTAWMHNTPDYRASTVTAVIPYGSTVPVYPMCWTTSRYGVRGDYTWFLVRWGDTLGWVSRVALNATARAC